MQGICNRSRFSYYRNQFYLTYDYSILSAIIALFASYPISLRSCRIYKNKFKMCNPYKDMAQDRLEWLISTWLRQDLDDDNNDGVFAQHSLMIKRSTMVLNLGHNQVGVPYI